MESLIKTICFCLVFIILEAISATKAGRVWFESLRRPRFSFGLSIWYIVGGAYYIIFGTIAYRLFAGGFSLFSIPFLLLFVVMLINGLSNFILFRNRSLRWFYLIIYPFAFILLSMIFTLYGLDRLAAGLACLYFLWLIYDLYYMHNLWKLNKTAT